jgi:hypothetical protein
LGLICSLVMRNSTQDWLPLSESPQSPRLLLDPHVFRLQAVRIGAKLKGTASDEPLSLT